MATRLLNLILAGVLTTCAVVGFCQTKAPLAAQDTRRKPVEILLLERDRILRGRITPGNESYQVEQDGAGTIYVPKSMVRFQAPDMHSIYSFLRDNLPSDSSANDHVRLARWCISNKLLPEARLELETALDQEPSRDDIRRNLATLDIVAARARETSKPVRSESPAERQNRVFGMGAVEAETLGGLPRDACQKYTTRIQPILMHNCTNSACHGPHAEHNLKFSMVRLGSASLRSTSEKNLLALLKYVNRDKPRSSPLWTILETNHGAQGRSIFTGLKGPQQLQEFQDWVLSLGTSPDLDEELPVVRQSDGRKSGNEGSRTLRLAAEKLIGNPTSTSSEPDRETLETKPPTPRRGSTRHRNSAVTSRTSSRVTPADIPSPESPSQFPEVEPIISTDPNSLPELPPEDPFDPEVFNRRQRIKRETESNY